MSGFRGSPCMQEQLSCYSYERMTA